MTIPSKLTSSLKKVTPKSPTDEIPTINKLTKSELLALSARHRRAEHQKCSARSASSLVAFIACVLVFDVAAVVSVDPECPGPFTHFTGLQPTFHLCMMITLHIITLIGALTRTVNGCRLAMAIAWLFFLLSVGVLIFTPAFIGSYVGSGLAPINKLTTRKHDTPSERFYAAFFMAIGGQFLVFVVFLAAIFQMTLIAELLREAHLIEDSQPANDSEEALVPPI